MIIATVKLGKYVLYSHPILRPKLVGIAKPQFIQGCDTLYDFVVKLQIYINLTVGLSNSELQLLKLLNYIVVTLVLRIFGQTQSIILLVIYKNKYINYYVHKLCPQNVWP